MSERAQVTAIAFDTNLSVNFTITLQDSDVRFILLDIDSKVAHGFLWGGTGWKEPHLFEVVARLPRRTWPHDGASLA